MGVVLLALVAAAVASATATDAAIVKTLGSKTVRVAVSSDGSYDVSVAGSSSTWLRGGVNQSLVAPLELTGVRTTQGTQSLLGEFEGVELSVASKPAAAALAHPEAACGPLEQNTDYHGNDIRFVNNVTEPAACCALCLAEKACAGFSLMGAKDAGTAWAKRCYLKSAMTHSAKFSTHISAKIPGRTPAPSPPGPPPGPPAPPMPPGTVVSLLLTIKYFAKLDLFLFEQQWPGGLELEYTSHNGLAAAFPLFDTTVGAAPALSGITWSGEMSGGEVCHGDSESETPCLTMGGSKAASGFGKETRASFCDASLYLNDLSRFYQDRLGTNTGKVHKKETHLCRGGQRRSARAARRLRRRCGGGGGGPDPVRL